MAQQLPLSQTKTRQINKTPNKRINATRTSGGFWFLNVTRFVHVFPFSAACPVALPWSLDAENKTMQRDMNLIRQLALYIEQAPGPLDSETINIEGYSSEQVGYHCAIIAEAGLVDFENLGKMDLRFMSVMIYRLSWAGHDFLDAARDDTIWNKTTKRIKDKATSMAFDGVLSLLKSAGQSIVGQVSEWVSQ